ncbi:SOS response-associated peptidase family protein [Corynebacterium bovis]
MGEGDPTDPAAAPGAGTSPVAAVGPARWGYPAPWASGGKVLFNARGETVFDKRSFAGSEPCLVVMNGWYEWFRPGGTGRVRGRVGVRRGAGDGAADDRRHDRVGRAGRVAARPDAPAAHPGGGPGLARGHTR